MFSRLTRRGFLAAGAVAARAETPQKKKTVAAIITEYRYLSHADVICGRFLDGYSPDNVRVEPRSQIVSMYTDQIAKKDMSRDLAQKHGFPIYPTIAESLCMGGSKLAVDAVLLVGEHGNYPTNEKGQKMYPRFDLYQRIIDVFKTSKRVVPVFSDKHLSYSWDRAHLMYKQSRQMGFPLMAGSSIPVTVRVPELELPIDCQIDNALVVGFGDLDAYGFHTLECLQCMVERRAGGEKGVDSVEWIEGDAVWRWRDSEQGRWSIPLLEAALSKSEKVKPGRPEENAKRPVAFLVQYRDGLQAVAYMLNGHAANWAFAANLKGKPGVQACQFGSSKIRGLAHFDGLVHCIEEMFITGKPLYPVERTLLTTGTLAFLFDSRMAKKRLMTPQLSIAYRAPQHAYFQKA